MVLRVPVARSTLMTEHGMFSYGQQHQRLGGHSETYEVARMVVRNRILANQKRQYYHLLLVFPQDFALTNAVFTPHHAPFGEIAPQITPVEVCNEVGGGRTVLGVELDVAFAATIIEDEPRRATPAATDNEHTQAVNNAMLGMFDQEQDD